MTQTLKEPKLMPLDNVCNWFLAMCCEGKPVTGPMVTKKAKCFYDKMKIKQVHVL